jgi:hypothetical protein
MDLSISKSFLSNEPCTPDVIVVRLNAIGKRWINGVSMAYDTEFPSALDGYVATEDFQRAMKHINSTMTVGKLYICCISGS